MMMMKVSQSITIDRLPPLLFGGWSESENERIMVKNAIIEECRRLLAGFGAGFGSGWIFVATIDQLIANRSLKRMEGRRQKVRSWKRSKNAVSSSSSSSM
jgi:hypothetical protein